MPWTDLGPCGAPPPTTSTSTSTSTTQPSSAFPVEDKYEAAGPYAVTVDSTSNASYKIHRPATLSATDKHPILTWANGTSVGCGVSASQLNHLASWGYVVICWENGQTGYGDGVWEAAQWMIAQDTTSGSPYFGKLDTAKVGAFAYYDGIPAGVPAAKASRIGANHFTTISDASGSVVAYVTAWFDYTLKNDSLARSAFVPANGVQPEIVRTPSGSARRRRTCRSPQLGDPGEDEERGDGDEGDRC